MGHENFSAFFCSVLTMHRCNVPLLAMKSDARRSRKHNSDFQNPTIQVYFIFFMIRVLLFDIFSTTRFEKHDSARVRKEQQIRFLTFAWQ
jgi:hypothetical protein